RGRRRHTVRRQEGGGAMSPPTGTCATVGCDAPVSDSIASPRGVYAVCARCCEEITATTTLIYDWALGPESEQAVARWRRVRWAAIAGYVASLALVASDRWVAWGAIGMFVAIFTWAFAAAAAEEES